MNRTNFNILVEQVIDEIRHRLLHKGKEYANNDNVFANFDKAAVKKNTTPILALEGMLAKHQVSIDDIVYGVVPYSKDMVMEKYLDEMCYRILQMGLLERENTPKEKSAVYTYPVYTPKGPMYPQTGSINDTRRFNYDSHFGKSAEVSKLEENPAEVEATVTEHTKTLYIKTIDGIKRVLTGNHTPVHGDLYIDDKENVFGINPEGDWWYLVMYHRGLEIPSNSMVVVKLDDFNCRDKANAYFEGNTHLYHDITFYNEEPEEKVVEFRRLVGISLNPPYLGENFATWEMLIKATTFDLQAGDRIKSHGSPILWVKEVKSSNSVDTLISLAILTNCATDTISLNDLLGKKWTLQ